MYKVRMNFAAVFCALIVGGCSTSTKEGDGKLNLTKSMHQPQIDRVVAVDPKQLLKKTKTDQDSAERKEFADLINVTPPPQLKATEDVKVADQIVTTYPVTEHNTKDITDDVSIPQIKSDDIKPKITTESIPTTVNSNWYALNKPKNTYPFELNKDEKYRKIISNWLKNAGYKKVEFVLTEADKALLNKKAPSPKTYIETLPLAIDKLLKDASSASESASNNGFYLSFVDQQVTLYSASQPMTIHQQSHLNTDNAAVSDLYLYKGETYESALMRWLNDAGYLRLGKLLSRETQIVLSQTIKESEVLRESLDKASTLLLYRARQQAMSDDRTEVDNFISNVAKANVAHHLYLNSEKKEAILTSSNQPVLMFNVRPGSLKDNFLELAKVFDWKADEAHYIADEYRINFGYPIVAEKGNIKTALNKLLADFSKLRGAIVPSTREAYVVMER